MDRLESFGLVRGINAEQRQVTVVASTGNLANDGAIIEPSGWDLSDYGRNPVVLWMHDASQLPVARTIASEINEAGLVQTHEFYDDDWSNRVFERVKRGYINAVSVRWTPGETEVRRIGDEYVLVFTRGHKLRETSYVTLPADSGALVLRADGSRVSYRDFTDPAPSLDERLRAFAAALRR